ncbi:hypothetical protein NMY22_g15758 [Coprinellus aureogranulatus]|nr:hypothetical protein NMY22_g15758 [Coprinellus aureogranulatus]
MIKYDLVDPNQMGGVRQRSTEDAGLFLTHLVRTGWVKGYHTSVVAFDIAQFFPSINHQVLLAVLRKQGFHPKVATFFASYLVQRFTCYAWNNFVSDPMQADVGVGQGSALSPVLSALVVAPIMKLYRIKEVGLGTTLITFVDDGTIAAQTDSIEMNCRMLYHAYAFIHALFTAAGLVLEHDKSEAFHFTRARSGADRPVDLGFAPHTGETPLRPKKFWRYLGFYFDQRLTFAEHIRYYSTKALTTVMAMRMLGNSTRGLSPKNKRILYRACVVPIATYGHRLWFYEGAKNVGALKTLSSMQRKATIWITGAFRTSPLLSERAVYRTATLSNTHPLRSLLPEGMRKGAKPHYSTACWLTPLKREKVRDAISQTAKVLPKLTESFQPCAEEAAPGTRLMDLYADQVDFNVFNKRWENALDVRRTELNTIWNSARVRHDALLIGTDASVPKDKHFQVVAAYCWEGLDDYELELGRVLAGRVLSTDAELTAIRFAIYSIAMARRQWTRLVHSGQTHSLAVCKALRRGSLVTRSAPSCLWRPLPS